jgi:hypothetical protein
MDINNLANMRLADFEQLNKAQYDKGFVAAMDAMIKLLESQTEDNCVAGENCSDPGYDKMLEILEGLKIARSNLA